MNSSESGKMTIMEKGLEMRATKYTGMSQEIEELKSKLRKEIMEKRDEWFPKLSEFLIDIVGRDEVTYECYFPPSYCSPEHRVLEEEIFADILQHDTELHEFDIIRCEKECKSYNIIVRW
jgi:hypothetical protein